MEKRNDWIRYAFEEEASEEFGPYMDCRHEFSPAFEKKMARMMKGAERPSIQWMIMQTAATIVLCIIAMFGGAVTVMAMDQPTAEAVIAFYEEHITMIFRQKEEQMPPEIIEEVYTLQELPEGYIPMLRSANEKSICRMWHNGNGGVILLNQNVLGTVYTIYAQEEAIAKIQVNGIPAYLYQKKRGTMLVWATSKYQFVLTCEGEGAEKINIAELAEAVIREAIVEEDAPFDGTIIDKR